MDLLESFLDFLDSPTRHRKNGTERTPGGSSRYMFWFGVYEGRLIAYKFNRHSHVGSTPSCMIISFNLRDFVRELKNAGLHITKVERETLAKELGE